eukprot:TRINITY_DN5228_c0_g2_i1.p1 TRINITY_DN5228_c0_g2~~TRINITY_DN5228_c0_g2_i1.p1  ORF type:complete len:340 (+),score=60.65 TRINITY_DN5228_c0_g2_i1:254-1273(+)
MTLDCLYNPDNSSQVQVLSLVQHRAKQNRNWTYSVIGIFVWNLIVAIPVYWCCLRGHCTEAGGLQAYLREEAEEKLLDISYPIGNLNAVPSVLHKYLRHGLALHDAYIEEAKRKVEEAANSRFTGELEKVPFAAKQFLSVLSELKGEDAIAESPEYVDHVRTKLERSICHNVTNLLYTFIFSFPMVLFYTIAFTNCEVEANTTFITCFIGGTWVVGAWPFLVGLFEKMRSRSVLVLTNKRWIEVNYNMKVYIRVLFLGSTFHNYNQMRATKEIELNEYFKVIGEGFYGFDSHKQGYFRDVVQQLSRTSEGLVMSEEQLLNNSSSLLQKLSFPYYGGLED